MGLGPFGDGLEALNATAAENRCNVDIIACD